MPSIQISKFPRLQKIVTAGLFQCFQDQGYGLRFVGGCVRDAFLGTAAHDVDLASTATPEEMIALFTELHIKWVPTGIEFGTITVVIDHIPYQITSLREDWQTDGRHAIVRYGTDWLEDAKRRDFTFNALYADETGNIFDYFQGIEDLNQGVVRFIGDIEARLHEDYLRILRFFRFFARFSKQPPAPQILEAFQAHHDQLNRLSRERITHEILLLLEYPLPLQALHYMAETDVFREIFRHEYQPSVVTALIALEQALALPPKSLRRLIAISGESADLRLSNAQKKLCVTLAALSQTLTHPPGPTEFYNFGYSESCEAYLLHLAQQHVPLDTAVSFYRPLLNMKWGKPEFPLTGKDLIKLGLKPGKKLGEHLKACENWWISLNFKPDRNACLAWIREMLN